MAPCRADSQYVAATVFMPVVKRTPHGKLPTTPYLANQGVGDYMANCKRECDLQAGIGHQRVGYRSGTFDRYFHPSEANLNGYGARVRIWHMSFAGLRDFVARPCGHTPRGAYPLPRSEES